MIRIRNETIDHLRWRERRRERTDREEREGEEREEGEMSHFQSLCVRIKI